MNREEIIVGMRTFRGKLSNAAADMLEADGKPLTDEEIIEIRRNTDTDYTKLFGDSIAFARAIEAHIRGEKT